MKLIVSISLNCILLFVFTTLITTPTWACGKHHTKNKITHHPTKCQKDCCKKDSKNKKKGCCDDDNDCICSVSTTVLGDLPQQLYFDIIPQRPVFILKRPFFYQQAFPKSSIQDIWQPPISVLSI